LPPIVAVVKSISLNETIRNLEMGTILSLYVYLAYRHR